MTTGWEAAAIVNDPRIDHNDPRLRAAAERVHFNESLHRHDPSGPVCIYCALVAANALRGADCSTPTPSSVTDEEAAERMVSKQVAADVAWMAKLARGSSWPGEMAQRVDDAAARVLDALEGR